MARFLLPDFKINRINHENDIISLLKIIKPSWKTDSVKMEPIVGGFSAKTIRCYEENGSLDSVTVRIKVLGEEVPKNDTELQIIQLLSKNGHFPTIHAIYANGYCYEYIKGKTIINPRNRREGRINDLMLSAIAKEMAYIHKIKLDGMDYTKSTIVALVDMMFSTRAFEKMDDSVSSKEMISEEMEFLDEYLLKKEPKIVTCHGDCHAGNFIWDDEDEKITFVDWEIVYPGYQMHNIAHFFVSATIIEQFCSNRTLEEVLPAEYKKIYFRNYLEEWYSSDDEKNEITEDEVDAWVKESEVYELVPILQFIAITNSYPDIVDDFCGDKIKFYKHLLNEYLSLKEKLIGRRSFEKKD